METYEKLLLEENKIQLLEPLRQVKGHHKMKCLICDHEWSATPLSKRQTLKKYGVSGCPNCNKNTQQTKKNKSRAANIQALKKRNIEVLCNWDGRRHPKNLITFINKTCGHTFQSTPTNVLARGIDCSVCGKEKRTKALNQNVQDRSTEWRRTADDWKLYKSEVASLTRQNYNLHESEINPDNLLRNKAGIPGAHHLDHIVPVRYCFENDIPANLCAHSTNLQMLNWRDNVGSRDKLKPHLPVPQIFGPYIL